MQVKTERLNPQDPKQKSGFVKVYKVAFSIWPNQLSQPLPLMQAGIR